MSDATYINWRLVTLLYVLLIYIGTEICTLGQSVVISLVRLLSLWLFLCERLPRKLSLELLQHFSACFHSNFTMTNLSFRGKEWQVTPQLRYTKQHFHFVTSVYSSLLHNSPLKFLSILRNFYILLIQKKSLSCSQFPYISFKFTFQVVVPLGVSVLMFY